MVMKIKARSHLIRTGNSVARNHNLLFCSIKAYGGHPAVEDYCPRMRLIFNILLCPILFYTLSKHGTVALSWSPCGLFWGPQTGQMHNEIAGTSQYTRPKDGRIPSRPACVIPHIIQHKYPSLRRVIHFHLPHIDVRSESGNMIVECGETFFLLCALG